MKSLTLTILLIAGFVGLSIADFIRNSLCYQIHNNNQKICKGPRTRKRCCKQEEVNFKNIDVFNTSGRVNCSRDCKSDNGQLLNDTDYETLVRTLFHSTKCFRNFNSSLSGLPNTNGTYFVKVRYACMDHGDREDDTDRKEFTNDGVHSSTTDDDTNESTEDNDTNESTDDDTNESTEDNDTNESTDDNISTDESAGMRGRGKGRGVEVTLAVSIPVSTSVIIIAALLACIHRYNIKHRTKTINNPNYHFPDSVNLNLDPVVTTSSKGNDSEYDEIPADNNSATLPCEIISGETTVQYGDTSTNRNHETHQAEIYNDLEPGRRTTDGSNGATGYDDHMYSQLEGVIAADEAEPEVPRPDTTKTSADVHDDQTSGDPLYFVLQKHDKQDRCDIEINDTEDENNSVQNHYFVLKKQDKQDGCDINDSQDEKKTENEFVLEKQD